MTFCFLSQTKISSLSLICFEKIFNAANLQLITYHQESIKSLTPNPGWVEQDPYEILNKTILCMEKAVEQLEQLGYHKTNIKGTETEYWTSDAQLEKSIV